MSKQSFALIYKETDILWILEEKIKDYLQSEKE